jgi:hypothetical protein
MNNSPISLAFINETALENEVKKVIDSAKKSLESNEKIFYKNSVDPFSALFDAMWQGIAMSEWVEQEKSRQNQKTLQNALGNFHQNILGSMNEWTNLGTGNVFDVKNDKAKIIAEVKNKHNTTKGNHKVAIYDDLKDQLEGAYQGYTAYYVEVIPRNKKIYNKAFTPPDNRTHTRRELNENIRIIDGKDLYGISEINCKSFRK